MSWQALNWAAEQTTGSPHAKLLLLLLANRADENGICWPSQIGLAEQAEQSDDTVQRYLKSLEKGGLIARARSRRTRGRWAGYVYQLRMGNEALPGDDLQERPARTRLARDAIRRAKNAPPPPCQISVASQTTPLPAARSTPLPAASPHRSQRFHQAAASGVEPSIEPSCETTAAEPSPATAAAPPGPRQGARQGRGAARLDLIQSQIAQRLGRAGWSILQSLKPDQLAQIEGMQRKGTLTDGALDDLRNEVALDAMRATA